MRGPLLPFNAMRNDLHYELVIAIGASCECVHGRLLLYIETISVRLYTFIYECVRVCGKR